MHTNYNRPARTLNNKQALPRTVSDDPVQQLVGDAEYLADRGMFDIVLADAWHAVRTFEHSAAGWHSHLNSGRIGSMAAQLSKLTGIPAGRIQTTIDAERGESRIAIVFQVFRDAVVRLERGRR